MSTTSLDAYRLVSCDIKSMQDRADRQIFFTNTPDNAERLAAHKELVKSQIVVVTEQPKVVYVRLAR